MIMPIDDIKIVINFGKYKGKTIANVMVNNAQYLLWADDNTKHFKLSDRLKKMAKGYAQSQYLQYLADRAWGVESDAEFDDERENEQDRDFQCLWDGNF